MELQLLSSFCIIIVAMKRYFAFILSGCVAANATALSLQDALDMAMANNSKIKAEKAKVDIAQSGEDEAFAREARYGAFRKRYAETGADGLILAHHADDQAETFIMRLLRGAGPDGLECMKTDEYVGEIRILRPMLSLRREEIRDALRADGISWREDASNTDTSFLRRNNFRRGQSCTERNGGRID